VLRCPDTDIILPLAGRMLDGRFRFLEHIGRGGMASVWLARNERVDRLVAIKLIRPEVARDDDMVARFRAEARAAGRIGHPNICDILDSGRSPIGPYIVMEYLRGRSLGELLAERGSLAPSTAVMVVREALRGLEAAHRCGIIHRDLKPENLFLHRPEPGEPTVKIMDFGVAKFTDGSGEVRTEHGALLGTPEYMAPEQFRGAAHAEPRTDIWAMGAILYRAITGRNAFGGPTVAATLLMVCNDEPAPMDALAPDVPSALVKIVARCLSKDPADRFAKVADLDAALAPWDSRVRDLSPWEAGSGEASDEPPPMPSEGSAPTNEWQAPALAGAGRRSSSRWWIAALTLFASAGAYALIRGDGAERIAEGVGVSDTPTSEPRDEPTPEPTPTSVETEPPPTIVPPRLSMPTPSEPTPSEPTPADSEGVEPPMPTSDTTPIELVDADTEGPAEPTPIDPTLPGGTIPPPPPPDPEGVVRIGARVALVKSLGPSSQRAAKLYCDRLGASGHLGIHGWDLPNPAQATKLTGNRSLRKGRYWTSAAWRGKGLVISLPSGAKTSISSTRGRARTTCVARWP